MNENEEYTKIMITYELENETKLYTKYFYVRNDIYDKVSNIESYFQTIISKLKRKNLEEVRIVNYEDGKNEIIISFNRKYKI